jgi:hypothetical protein
VTKHANETGPDAVGTPVERGVRRHATALAWLNSLRPALPLSIEQPPTKENPAQPMSNGELKRHMQQGGVLVNGEKVAPDELIDFPVFSLVFFPKAGKRTTLV